MTLTVVDDPWLTIDTCAVELDCSDETVRRAIKGGRLRAFKDGNHVRVRRSWLAAYIDRHTTAPAALTSVGPSQRRRPQRKAG